MNELSSLAWSDRCGSVKPVKKFRDPWVDIIRVLAMLVIMFQHTPTSHAPLDYVTSSGVFFFFMAAGYFLGLKYEKSPFLVPWLNWRKASLILSAYLFWIFISMLVFGFPSNLVDWVTNLGIGRFPVGAVLWFLRDLMVFVLISGILFRMPRSCLAIFSLTALVLFSTRDPLCLEWMGRTCCVIHPRGLGAFAFGMVLCRYSLVDMKNFIGKVWIYVLVMFPAVFIWEMYNNISASALSLFMGVLWLSSCALLLTRYFPRIAAFCAHLGPSIFFVYVSHALVYEGLFKLGLPKATYWVWGIVIPLVFLTLSGLYFLLGRICPAVLKYIALKN